MIFMNNIRQIAFHIIHQVFRQKAYADYLIESAFLNNDLEAQQKGYIVESVNGTIRMARTLEWVLKQLYNGRIKNIPRPVRVLMYFGLYQLIFMKKAPDYAVVKEMVDLARLTGHSKWSNTVNALLRAYIRSSFLPEENNIQGEVQTKLGIVFSYPDWIIKRWIECWGEEKARSLCAAFNRRPALSLRVNRLKTDREFLLNELIKRGKNAGISNYHPDCIRVEKAGDLAGTRLFKSGYFSFQDESAACTSWFVAPEAKDLIFDIAAAPGGKTGHMAEISRDQAVIAAGDIRPARIEKIRSMQKRLGFCSIFPILNDGLRPAFTCVFNKVLLDAPCSGLGVLGKRAELRWNRNSEELKSLQGLQQALLNSGAALVKPGGLLVYSTCSILPEENELVVEKFLHEHSGFKVENVAEECPEALLNKQGMMRTWPDIHNMDGAFAVRMRRKE